ncbi:GNAT family N-acetyltransferase [Glutamicibacter sp. MCAF14]|uniref:GNAT family N-acetyltransferase n=1 Tax=Glutamicibacter sp. MCAF14 TaxID=3233043 RepID=UPI003F92785B
METSQGWNSIDQAQQYGENLLRDAVIDLRESEQEDFAHMAGWWNDPAWAVLQQRTIKPRPEAPLAEMFAQWSRNIPYSGDAGFSIFERGTGTFIGHITLHGGVLPHRAAELAVMIGPDFVRQGFGTRAIKLMTGYGFRELGLHRISLCVAVFNPRAIRSYEKAGFTLEGRQREVYFHNGQFHDQVLLSLLSHEYFARQG